MNNDLGHPFSTLTMLPVNQVFDMQEFKFDWKRCPMFQSYRSIFFLTYCVLSYTRGCQAAFVFLTPVDEIGWIRLSFRRILSGATSISHYSSPLLQTQGFLLGHSPIFSV